MKTEYILLIVAGGVFALLLLIYAIIALKDEKRKVEETRALTESYSPEKLTKMEYDVAFYDAADFRLDNNLETQRQVTIDDVLSEDAEANAARQEAAVYKRVGEGDVEVIAGKYNPSN